MNNSPREIVRILQRARVSLAREKETQAEIASVFDRAGVAYDREVDLGDRNIIDFIVRGGPGVEVKIGGSKRDIFGQCKRYCETGRLSSLILATNVATGFPAEVAGVPCYIASLGRGWL